MKLLAPFVNPCSIGITAIVTQRGIGLLAPALLRWGQAQNDSWRVDKTYIEIKGMWKYLYRAVDSEGNTLDFLLSAKRDAMWSTGLRD